jgi:two-component system, OmpR family, sensor histidine kinase VanS
MSKMGITKKLFIITSVIFAVFIVGTLLIQSLFFQRFYVYRKKVDLTSTIDKFKTEYNKTENDDKAGQLLEEYEANGDIKIVILDSSNRLKLLTRTTNSRIDMGKTRDLTLFIQSWADNSQAVADFKKNNSSLTVLPRTLDGTVKNIVAISSDNQKGEVIFAITSLQPVNEAVSVIKDLYAYFAIGAVFIIVILALIYSNMIAKPLVKINKIATKMANLDFDEKCEVKSNDEIGNVASSLNFLSENLNTAMNSLKKANVKLEKDIEKERNLEKMRKEFVAAVSHELKTPITLIDGYAVGLKDNIFEGEDKDYYLDIIIDEAEKMGNLVSEMLDLSHLESGSFKLSKEKFNLSELIKFTLSKYEAIFHEKNVMVETKLLEEILVYADWNRIEQILTNFITNALRHVEDNGSIYVNTIEEESKISIEIENTGLNIPEEDLLKVWDRFYKVDKSRNRRLGGTGIGLSIVKNILQLHGYSFGAKNTDTGVIFYFKVPKNIEINKN